MEVGLDLVANGYPFVSEVVPSSKNFEIEAVWDKILYQIVDFVGFLGLSSPLAENDITPNTLVILKVLRSAPLPKISQKFKKIRKSQKIEL